MWGVNDSQMRNLRGGLNAAHDASGVTAWLGLEAMALARLSRARA